MAFRVELDQKTLNRALSKEIASLKRQLQDANLNPLMREIIEKDLNKVATASNTITEIK